MWKQKIILALSIFIVVIFFVFVYMFLKYKNISSPVAPTDETPSIEVRREEIKTELLNFNPDPKDIKSPEQIKKELVSKPPIVEGKAPSKEEVYKSLTDPNVKVLP